MFLLPSERQLGKQTMSHDLLCERDSCGRHEILSFNKQEHLSVGESETKWSRLYVVR